MEAIVDESSYALSIVIVSVGDVPWADMRKFDDMIPKREFNNFLLRFESNSVLIPLDCRLNLLQRLLNFLCVILEEGNIVASGLNRTNETGNRGHKTCRDEAIDELIGQWQKDRLSPSQVAEKFSKCVLYVTCEPCIMCASTLSFLVKNLKEEKCRGIMADAAVSLFNSVL
ncbi:hypothetical protein IGI04_001100 [Brassica rapa subsp. trilocularis]|uniref:CMP/dCMP-type deaminase domain-containing protein n=1 Tax=Brassica rapa subsp. trilocularis TaxID=1813537 RepID=A0ABQ7NRX5_BRACM|nr:hypothetical protein IGI04_001100 [Brassica rapa subsp. trilocularis]